MMSTIHRYARPGVGRSCTNFASAPFFILIMPSCPVCVLKCLQLYLHEFKVTQHEACIIAVQVLPESHTPNQHKVKLAGVVVSEEGIKNHLAVAATSGHDKQ